MSTTATKERPILFSGPMVNAIQEGRKTQTRRVAEPLNNSVDAHRTFKLIDGKVYASVDESEMHPEHPNQTKWGGGVIDGYTEVRVGKGKRGQGNPYRCPYGEPGDRLWVRCTWADVNTAEGPAIAYKLGDKGQCHVHLCRYDAYPVEYERYPGCQFTMWLDDLLRGEPDHGWRPSIHMPKALAWLWLEITDVRLQQIQEIGGEDCCAEGIQARGINDGPPTEGDQYAEHRWLFAALWASINAERGYAWHLNPWVWALTFRVIEPEPTQ